NLVYQRMNNKPLTIIEIGSSAGIHLIWDQFYYDYGALGQVGNHQAGVKIKTELRGQYPPPIPIVMPVVSHRLGIDIHPINPNDGEATRWLRALIWPEHRDRRVQLEAALEQLRSRPVEIVKGN